MQNRTKALTPAQAFSRRAGRCLAVGFLLLVASALLVTLYWIFRANGGGLLAAAENVPLSRTIVIDPGHGGPDGGAIGYDGTVEKEINLAISLRLESFFQAAGYNVIMTRSDDRSIHDEGSDTIREMKSSDLHNRLKIENSHPHALFISIHQNKFSESQYSGTQVFYSQQNSQSKTLATHLQSEIRTLIQPDNTREIKPAGKNLYIIYYAKPPSVMVECGFLSNPAECDKLKTDAYQNQMAFAIFSGVLQYYSDGQGSGASASGETSAAK